MFPSYFMYIIQYTKMAQCPCYYLPRHKALWIEVVQWQSCPCHSELQGQQGKGGIVFLLGCIWQ